MCNHGTHGRVWKYVKHESVNTLWCGVRCIKSGRSTVFTCDTPCVIQ